MKFGRVIVGIDAARLADQAVRAAVHLARLLGARLEIVHAVDTRSERPWFASEPKLQALRDQAVGAAREHRADHLTKSLRDLATTPTEIDDALTIAVGHPATVLRERAAAEPGTLLVLGGHRRRGVLDLGGTGRELLSRPPCPIWIHGGDEGFAIDKILAAVDLSAASDTVAGVASTLAAALPATPTWFYCYEAPIFAYSADMETESGYVEEFQARERQEFEAYVRGVSPGEEPQMKFVTGDPAEAILEAERDYDLLVMGTQGHSAIGRIFLGSHAYHVVSCTKKPIVIVPCA